MSFGLTSTEMRGLRLVDGDFSYFNRGAYGAVFVDHAATKIRKVYLKSHDEPHAQAVFKSETAAYRLALSVEAIAPLIPRNFKICATQKITDIHGGDLTASFFPGLAFEAEFLSGQFFKIGEVGRTEAERIRRLFREAGIMHTGDMSVLIGSDGKILKVIDFAMEEHELWH